MVKAKKILVLRIAGRVAGFSPSAMTCSTGSKLEKMRLW